MEQEKKEEIQRVRHVLWSGYRAGGKQALLFLSFSVSLVRFVSLSLSRALFLSHTSSSFFSLSSSFHISCSLSLSRTLVLNGAPWKVWYSRKVVVRSLGGAGEQTKKPVFVGTFYSKMR